MSSGREGLKPLNTGDTGSHRVSRGTSSPVEEALFTIGDSSALVQNPCGTKHTLELLNLELLNLELSNHLEPSNHKPHAPAVAAPTVYWRVEGSLLDLTVVQPVAFFTWNAQTFAERFRRRGLIFLMALLRPFLYSTNRKFATRVVHTVLRGVTRDRLDLLGEEFFQYKLQPNLKEIGVQQVRELVQSGAEVVLVSQALEHVMRPLAEHLGVKHIVANRLEFRDGMATGRLLDPVIRPRGAFARIREENPDGRRAPKTLARQLNVSLESLRSAVVPADRQAERLIRPAVHFEGQRQPQGFSVRRAFAG